MKPFLLYGGYVYVRNDVEKDIPSFFLNRTAPQAVLRRTAAKRGTNSAAEERIIRQNN